MNNDLKIFEYTPLQVKQGICGYGRADKKQVQSMVKSLLNLKEILKPDDAAGMRLLSRLDISARGDFLKCSEFRIRMIKETICLIYKGYGNRDFS